MKATESALTLGPNTVVVSARVANQTSPIVTTGAEAQWTPGSYWRMRGRRLGELGRVGLVVNEGGLLQRAIEASRLDHTP